MFTMIPDQRQATLDVSVVLPTLNEEASVGLCVLQVLEACGKAGLQAEVIVVDNNCTDNSAEVARQAGARVVSESVPGYGAAIRCGIAASLGTVVVMADADCTYPLDRVAELVVPVLTGETDLAIGSRLDAATRNSMPALHRFVGTPTLTYLVREGTGTGGLTDSQSGFRAFRRDVIASLGLQSEGMEFASEMLIAAARAELRIRELPLGYRQRVGESKLSTWSDGWRHLRLILRMNPHMVLWHPGQVGTGLGLLTFGLSALRPGGMQIGSVLWQPVFFSSLLLVLGLGAMLAGAALAHHNPAVSPKTRRAFSWVGEPTFLRRALRTGLGLFLAGLWVDSWLFAAWIAHWEVSLSQRITLAGLGQALLICGALLSAFSACYQLVVSTVGSCAVGRRDL